MRNKPVPNKKLSISTKVKIALLSHVYEHTKLGIITSLVCATVILFGVYSPQISRILFVWYALFLVITLARFVLAHIYKRYKSNDINKSLWQSLFIFGAFLGGLSWGIVGAILFPIVSTAQQTLIILILAGLTAGAVPLLAGVLNAAIIFLLSTLFPLMWGLILAKTPIYLFFDIAALAYTIYLCVLALETHRLIKSSINLKFENDELLKNLLDAKNTLEYTATHDPLTHVANRNLFEISFANALKRAEREGTVLALLYIDLDNFKEVNDIYGHHIGDQVLISIVGKFKKILREVDLIARLGGDEFTIILENISHPDVVGEIAKKICTIIATSIKLNDVEINLSASIGISIYPLDASDTENLLKAADKAMYYVKKHGHNNFHYAIHSPYYTHSST